MEMKILLKEECLWALYLGGAGRQLEGLGRYGD